MKKKKVVAKVKKASKPVAKRPAKAAKKKNVIISKTRIVPRSQKVAAVAARQGKVNDAPLTDKEISKFRDILTQKRRSFHRRT